MKPASIPRFNAFTTRYDRLVNRILTEIRLYPAYDPALSPPTQEYRTHGLWDTGATNTVITHATVAAMGLKPVGLVTISTASGTGQAHTYLINVGLPNHVGVTGVIASECENITGDNIGALIGMDIISQGDFSITNVDGKTCVSYRFPSISTIDYVTMAKQLGGGKVNPNDQCPCGSGRKYKKCCGVIDA